MIVDHPGRLHEGVADRRADELEAALASDPCSSRRDSAVLRRHLLSRRQRFCIGRPPTKLQMYASNVPNSFCTARNAFALSTAAFIFRRLRTMPASASSAVDLRFVVTRRPCCGSKSSKALR